MSRTEIWKYLKSYSKKKGIYKIGVSKRLYDKLLFEGAVNNVIPFRTETGKLDFITLYKHEDY